MKRAEQDQAAQFALECLKKGGADKAQVFCTISQKEELNFNLGEISLLRSTADYSLALCAIHGSRTASLTVNQLGKDAITEAAAELKALCEAGVPDPAHDIAPFQAAKNFSNGPVEADLPKMRERMSEYLSTVKGRHSSVILEEGFVDFVNSSTTCLNSNGVHFHAQQGRYGLLTIFSAKEGMRTSGFNYTHGNLPDLNKPLLDCLGVAEILRESTEQLDGRSIPEKFTGDVLITPHCLGELLGSYLGYLSDGPMIAGTSVFRGKLGERVASPLLSLKAEPRSPELAVQEFFDGDGFESFDTPLIERGVLKSYMLSQYGANKTGLPRALSSGSRLFMEPGSEPKAELLRSMKRGLVLGRFSGGRPSLNGDFSGVAKNSFYVENGEIRYSVAETMVSGNLVKLFESLEGVSRERISFGMTVLPWLLSNGVTISGK